MQFASEENMSRPNTISPKQEDKKKETPWKLIIFCFLFVFLFLMVMFWPPAKQILLDTEAYLQGQGWYGRILMTLIIGFIVVPIGLPYSMFQMLFALVVKGYWLSLFLTCLAQTIGAAIAYILTKHVLREQIRGWFHKHKMFRGVEAILMKDPVKFSVILNLTNIPTIIKNYALAMPENIGAKVYMSTAILGIVFTSAPQIYVFQEASELGELFDHKRSTLSTVFTCITTILSLAVIIYVMWYTKKILNDLDNEVVHLNRSVDHHHEIHDIEANGVALDIKETKETTASERKSADSNSPPRSDAFKLIKDQRGSLEMEEPYLDNLAC
jgi:uncharacterized membrane protein YdjX (TVP38/TMEM64 family)